MKLTPIAAAMVAVLSLTACGKGGGTAGVNATSESNQGLSTDVKGSFDHSKDLTVGQGTKVTAEADFGPLLAMTYADVLPVINLDIDAYSDRLFFRGGAQKNVLSAVPVALRALGFGDETGEVPQLQKDAAAAERARLEARVGLDGAADSLIALKLVCLDATLAGDYAKARSCYEEYLTYAYQVLNLHLSRVPVLAKSSALHETNRSDLGNQRSIPAAELTPYGYALVNLSRDHAEVEQRIKDALPVGAFTAKDRGKRIMDALLAIPAADLRKLAVATAAPAGLKIEIAPGQPKSPLTLLVPALGASFAHNEKGIVESRGGAPYNGDGYNKGVKLRVAVDASLDAKQSQKTSTSGSTTINTGTSDKADVSVGSK